MLRTNVYIDGFNLYYGCLKGTPYKWLDLDALCRRLLPRHELGRIRYFTAIVAARPPDSSGPVRQRTYLRALATMPHLSIHLGRFLTSHVRMPLVAPPVRGPRTVEVIKTEEKGSDVNLATYLLADAFRQECEAAESGSARRDVLQAAEAVHSPGVPAPRRAERPPRHDTQA